MACVVDVLDDLFVLPVTLGAVGVLEDRQCAPGDVLGRLHHPLESPAGAIAGGDTDRHDAFNCASVKAFEGLRGQAEFLHHPEIE